MNLGLLRRKRRGIVERPLSPGYSGCLRCHRPWKFAEGHVTDYDQGRGCLPLCEPCWADLTPEERLPFYEDLVWSYWTGSPGRLRRDWALIRAAVLEGK